MDRGDINIVLYIFNIIPFARKAYSNYPIRWFPTKPDALLYLRVYFLSNISAVIAPAAEFA